MWKDFIDMSLQICIFSLFTGFDISILSAVVVAIMSENIALDISLTHYFVFAFQRG